MRQWQGVRDDVTALSEVGLRTANNVSFYVEGECRRRPGLQNPITETGILVTEWTDPFGVVYLVYNSGSGTLRSVKVSDGTETTIASSLATSRGCYAHHNGRLYFCNGFNAMQRIERGTATAGSVGISAPESAIGTPTSTTGNVTSGTHLLRYRYYDSKSLYMSDPSGQLSFTVTGTQTLTFSIGTGAQNIVRSQDAKVDQVIIEMTDSASSTFYRAATVNQALTGTTISVSDADLILLTTASRDGDFSHQPPPLFSMMCEHRGRVFGFGQLTTTITGVTVSTASSATFTVTGSTFSSGWAGFLTQFDTGGKAYRISAMSGTALGVLSEVFTGTAATKTGVVFFSPTPDMLYWTRAGFPEAYNATSFAKRVMQKNPDLPSGVASFNEVLLIFGQRTIRGLDFASDPALGQIMPIAADMGLWNNNCKVDAGGMLYGWGRSGAWMMVGLNPVHISKAIDPTLEGRDSATYAFDPSKYEQFWAEYNPRERVITWHYCTSSDTYPKHGVAYDIDRKVWSTRTWKQALRCGCLTTGDTSHPTRTLVADENGYSWYLTADEFDGVPSTMTGGEAIVISGTTTVVTVSGNLSTGLAGCIVTTASGEERLISASTATTYTVSSAFTAAPSAGAIHWLGMIPVTLRTKWLDYSNTDNLKRPNYLAIRKLGDDDSGKLFVSFYLDGIETLVTFTKNSSDIDPFGVTIVNGQTYCTVDIDDGAGHSTFVPLPSDWFRSISIQITCTKPQSVLKLLDFELLFVDPRSVARVAEQ